MTRPTHSIWIVHGGYGMWVVRADSKQEAEDIAFHGPALDRDTTGQEYGHEREDFEAFEASPQGAAGIIDSYYA